MISHGAHGVHIERHGEKRIARNLREASVNSAFSVRILFLILLTQSTMAQTVSELRKLPKDSLIKMAAKKITEPSFDIKDFTRIEIWAEGDEITVDFDHAIRFIPMKGQFYYNVSVELVRASSSRQIIGDGPFDEEVHFFKLTNKHQEKIQFVRDAINNSNGEVGKIPEGQLPDGTMTITEKATYFDISVDSESTHSYYKIEKGTGKIYDAGHKHYMRDESDSNRQRIY